MRFKKRIAAFNTLAAAGSILPAFVAVYAVVYFTAYRHLDSDIRREKEAVARSLSLDGGQIRVLPDSEWQEREHNEVEVNPTFLQIVDVRGALVFQSANLKHRTLNVDLKRNRPFFSDQYFHREPVRLGQFPLADARGAVLGYLSIGVSQAEAVLVLHNLLWVLALAFPLLCLIFYLVSSYAAQRGIAPIHTLVRAAQGIDDRTVSSRLPLPAHRDEIHLLAETINELLARIERSLQREKQITADISHELRTPLAGIRGTLEVLLRKTRSPEQYEEKLERVMQETDRMNAMLEQLLQLSRIEAGIVPVAKNEVALAPVCSALQEKWEPLLAEKSIRVFTSIPASTHVLADAGILELILGNLLSNAVKYGREGGRITLRWDDEAQALSVGDDGPGISSEHLPYIFDRFYRSDLSRNAKIPGVGLGLSIAKKLAELQGWQLSATSEEGLGTTFTLTISPTVL